MLARVDKDGITKADRLRPAMASEKKYHVGLAKGDVGDYVLVPGDPGRTPLIAKYLDDAHEVAFSREYRTFTGTVDGVPVSDDVVGHGRAVGRDRRRGAAASWASTRFLRVGTCGAAQPEIKMGDLVIADGSVRSEGTPERLRAARISGGRLAATSSTRWWRRPTAAGAPYHLGVIRSVDALYSDLVPDQMPRARPARRAGDVVARRASSCNDMEIVHAVRRLPDAASCGRAR